MRAGGSLVVLAVCLACGGGGGPAAAGDPQPDTPDDLLPGPEAPAPPDPARCALEPRAVQWSVEGDLVEVKLSCGSGIPLPADVAVGDLPEGARWDAARAAIVWQPRLDQAGTWTLQATIPSTGETSPLRIGVVDRFDARGNVPPDPQRYVEEYGLPVFHIQTSGTLSRDVYRPVTVTYRGRTYSAQAKIRGVTSSHYPKKGWNLEFAPGDLLDSPDLGLRGRKKVALIADFDDSSHLRNRLCYEIWKRMDPEHLGLVHASAVVYLDRRYHGLYTFTEKVGGQFLSRHGLWGDGNLYQAISHDANFDLVDRAGLPKSPLWTGFEKDEGSPLQGEPGAFADLDELIRFVASSSDGAFEAGLPQRTRLADYESWWTFVVFVLASDGAAKNTFHFHDPRGGPWRAMPWDFNATLGQNWQTERASARTDTTFSAWNRMFRRLLDHPRLGPRLRARMGEVLRGPLDAAAITQILDALAAQTREAALRDEKRWGDAYRAWFSLPEHGGRTDFAGYDDEIRYLRSWIAARSAFLARRYPPPAAP